MPPQCRVAGCLSPAQPLRRGTAVDMGLASVLERAPLAEVLPLVRRG